MCEEKEMSKLDLYINNITAVGFLYHHDWIRNSKLIRNSKYIYCKNLHELITKIQIKNYSSIHPAFWNGNGIRCVRKKK